MDAEVLQPLVEITAASIGFKSSAGMALGRTSAALMRIFYREYPKVMARYQPDT